MGLCGPCLDAMGWQVAMGASPAGLVGKGATTASLCHPCANPMASPLHPNSFPMASPQHPCASPVAAQPAPTCSDRPFPSPPNL